MKRINFSYPALVLIIVGFAVSLTGCGQNQELDSRTQPELVRIVEIGSSSGADPAFTGVVSARVQSNFGFRVPGKITSRLVDTGQFVRAGQPLMTIDRTDYVHAITARAETVTAAKAKAVQAAADEARYVLDGAATNATLGATVTVHLSGDGETDTLQVPVASIVDQGKGPGIWLLNASTSTVTFQPVQVRQLGEELAIISGNLHPGQQVVALGVHLLHDGQRVRVETKAELR